MSTTIESVVFAFLSLQILQVVSWLPDTKSKLKLNDEHGLRFEANHSVSDHLTFLHQDDHFISIGARNTVYNLSLSDLTEHRSQRIDWPSSGAHRELCLVKGKTEDDCQNYIRILVKLSPDLMLVCGTNSFKPLCRHYALIGEKFKKEKEYEALGICPYDPEHNSTAIYSHGQLFTATVADFSGGDPLIYREPQRTERYDLKQLNAPDFVTSFAYGDYIFFLYREIAVEYINCGKAVYSRIARVCKDDKGGPHQFGDRWTSFLKTRLNCSIPGDYPFYFDEIQSASDIVEGAYGSDGVDQIIYGTFTTPSNAIGGSAVCAFRMKDVLAAFEGPFKEQESINSNWLPVPSYKVPDSKPGRCVKDSRTLPDIAVNFVKTHSLMENTVPTHFGHPLLIRVSFQYRFTVIAVEPQVRSIEERPFDILYIGTDDGRVLKVVNIPYTKERKAVVISESQIFSNSTPVRGIRVTSEPGKIVVITKNFVRLVNLTNCGVVSTCAECVTLQDPACAWDIKHQICAEIKSNSYTKKFIQDVIHGDIKKCRNEFIPDKKEVLPTLRNEYHNKDNDIDNEITYGIVETNELLNSEEKPNLESVSVQVKERLVIYTAETLHVVVIASSIAALAIGFVAGYLFSRRFHQQPQFAETPFIEQHNHLNRLTNIGPNSNGSGFLAPRANKAINLVVNNSQPSVPSKKDNLESTKDLNISNEGTLQKIKKTYI